MYTSSMYCQLSQAEVRSDVRAVFYFSVEHFIWSSMIRSRQLPACLHVTHGLLCPSPALSSLNLLAKYVKANPGPSVLFQTGLQHGGAAERLQWTLRGPVQPVSRERGASLWRNSTPRSLCFRMSLPVVLPSSCCPVTGTSQLAEPSYRNRPRGLSASSRIAGGGSRLLLPGRPLLSLGLLQLLLGGSMVALSFGALSLSNSPSIRNSCPFWAGSSVG